MKFKHFLCKAVSAFAIAAALLIGISGTADQAVAGEIVGAVDDTGWN
ncbi:hypothetical protein [Streptomyces sp. NPDC055749]